MNLRTRAARVAAAVLAAALAAGCGPVATVSGVAAGSPDVARLLPQGGGLCPTPCRIDLGALPDEFELRIEVPGFQAGRVMMRRHEDSWQADITDLGPVPCLAIDAAHGDVYAADFGDVRRMQAADALSLGAGEAGFLYGVAVTRVEPSWARVTRLWPE